jgi:hypothetical protein
MRNFKLTFVLFLLQLPTNASGDEIVCSPLRLKPLHCICGTFIDSLGDPIAHGTVKILRDGAQLTTIQTGTDGTFSVKGLKESNYDLRVEADGFLAFQFKVVVKDPRSKCKRALQIRLATATEHCTGVRLVNQTI